MKTFFLILIVALLILSTQAFAAAAGDVVNCSVTQPAADNDIHVSIVSNTATLTRETPKGSEIIETFDVQFQGPIAGIQGTKATYQGGGFLFYLGDNDTATMFVSGANIGLSADLLCTVSK